MIRVDAIGRHCPVPVIELAKRIDDIDVGDTVELLADDPAAAADVAAWCRMRGHELVATQPREDNVASYLIRRLH